jgi:hypothetical protein
MIKNNIKYKEVVRLQFFGDDNINNNARFQYSTVNTSKTNAIRMKFDLGGNLGNVILSKNARIVVESAYISALTNATTRIAVLRLLTSTADKTFDSKPFFATAVRKRTAAANRTFDSKKGINGNPVLFCLGLSGSANALTNFKNGHDMFYSLNIPSNFLSKGFIEIELEVPSQTSLSIAFVNNLVTFCLTLIIIDVDPELTLDNTLASPFDSNNSNNNFPIKQY